MHRRKEKPKEKDKITVATKENTSENIHLGSSNAFEETESMDTHDAREISDEKLDEIIGEE